MRAEAADPSAQGGAAAAAPAIALRGVNKSFGPVRANSDISLDVAAGTIHGIIGENGAGKSTLMSILYGYYQADSGDIQVFGKPLRLRSTSDAIGAGIGMVFQHFMLVDPFTVLENVVLGAEGGALLIVSDDGPGIDAETLEKVQEPFFTTKDGGTGLGLSICRSLVWQHGGRLRIRSTPGEGTEVRVSLPAATSAQGGS